MSIHTALKSSCSVSYDRPSVCRCSSRSGGVPGEASKSSQGSGGGEPRLSESFSMFIHPAPLLLLLLHRLRRHHPASKCRENSLTPALPPPISPSLHFPFHRRICQFFPNISVSSFPLHLLSPPLLVVTSLPSPSTNFCICQSPRTSPSLPPKPSFSSPSSPLVEQHIQQYINLHTSL